jgi:hypothetical protein
LLLVWQWLLAARLRYPMVKTTDGWNDEIRLPPRAYKIMKQLKDKNKTLFNLLQPALRRIHALKSWHVLRMVSNTICWHVITSLHELKWFLTRILACHHNDIADTDTWPIRDMSGDLVQKSLPSRPDLSRNNASYKWTSRFGKVVQSCSYHKVYIYNLSDRC